MILRIYWNIDGGKFDYRWYRRIFGIYLYIFVTILVVGTVYEYMVYGSFRNGKKM